MEWRTHDGLEWLSHELDGARVAFSTRVGGRSRGPFRSLNLGILTEDERTDVLGNRLRLASALEIDPERVAMARQVHGADLAGHGPGPIEPHFTAPGPEPEHRDGHFTRAPGTALMVLVADCLPVALRGEKGVAMLHCGWRGLAAGIIDRGVAAVSASSAAIGPGIGRCCFEVGPEVSARFADLGPGIGSGRMLDLAEIARRQLRRAGVGSVASAGICTHCHPEKFFSHRRDRGLTGRQAGLAWLGPAPGGS